MFVARLGCGDGEKKRQLSLFVGSHTTPVKPLFRSNLR